MEFTGDEFLGKTNIKSWGNSNGIRLTKTVMEKLGFVENEELDMIVQDDMLVLKPAKPQAKKLSELFEQYPAKYPAESIQKDWENMEPQGEELW